MQALDALLWMGKCTSSFFRYRLSIHSGGVRGIVELEVLNAVERALGGKIRIQAFFDLIVGTR